MGVAAELAAANAAVVPRPRECPATHSLLSTALSLALRAPPRPFFAVVAPSPPEQPPALRLLAWPGQLGPPRHEPRLPTGARVPWVLPRHSTAVGAASAGRSRGPSKPLLRLGEQEREKDFALKFEKREGSFCEVMTHVNSAQEDLFADV